MFNKHSTPKTVKMSKSHTSLFNKITKHDKYTHGMAASTLTLTAVVASLGSGTGVVTVVVLCLTSVLIYTGLA